MEYRCLLSRGYRDGQTCREAGLGTGRHTPMKAATVAGIVLIIVGIIGFSMGGFTFTREKKDVDMGPIQIEHQQKKSVPIPPILSTIALVGGIALVVVGVRSR